MSLAKLVTRARFLLLLLPICFGGCAVIHFENGDVAPSPYEPSLISSETLSFGLIESSERDQFSDSDSLRYRRWYHHAIFQVAELSNPVELDQVCRGLEWNQVTTEVTPLDAFFGLLDNALLYNASSVGLDLWSLWSVEYSCRP